MPFCQTDAAKKCGIYPTDFNLLLEFHFVIRLSVLQQNNGRRFIDLLPLYTSNAIKQAEAA
ncbi:hypothetical protein HMPREF9120_01452 [Neisseria sp. oral taxon 020 str. F0370]|nr:hypothetical protein HMPREF9120_01452 [Neisseria sp. oral taxon 020 str. F0370]